MIIPFGPDNNLEIRRVPRNPKVPHSQITNRNYNKVFCIGNHKTGTTSIDVLLRHFGFTVGNQSVAEMLMVEENDQRKIERVIRHCHTADAFQDSPFMDPKIYKALDASFPDSKFILTVRDSADQWFQSLVKFHTKKFSSDISKPPSERDLQNADYLYRGWMLDAMKVLWNFPSVPLYDEGYYKSQYEKLNEEAISYFKNRPDSFIKINVSQQADFVRLCNFLNVETTETDFPWENKT